MRIALDTNVYSAMAAGNKTTVYTLQSAQEIFVPIPVLAELRFGFLKSTKRVQHETYLTRFLSAPRVKTLDCDEQTTHFYSQLKFQLDTQGTPIPINDIWIASLVIQHGVSLFSFDSDFDRIPQLLRVR